MAHTLTRNGVVTSTCFRMQHTHAHNMLSHNTLPHKTCSPIHVHVFKMYAHTLPLHTRLYSHMHTHGWLDTHRPTVTHLCPPQDAQIHPRTDRKRRQDHRETSPDPTTPMTTSQRHTQLKNTHRVIPSLTRGQPPKSHNAHRKRHTEGHTRHTHLAGCTYRLRSMNKVTASCSRVHRSSHPMAGPSAHPGQGYPDPGSSAVIPAQPGSLSPLQGPVKQHHQQIKSECAKIKPKGCDKAVPFPQDSALTQVLLSAINIFILILKDISITSLALDPARRYLACWATLRPHWAARRQTQAPRPYAPSLQVTLHDGC